MKLSKLVAYGAVATGLSFTALPASAGPLLEGSNVTVGINDGAYPHEYLVAYTCGVDGVITFTGSGKAADNDGESISGSLDTSAQTFTYAATYVRADEYTYTLTGVIAGTSGGVDLTGTSGTSGVYNGSGEFTGVPNCAPAPVAGNHGQYVSGAAKAGVKGKALADIAKNPALVGPYLG